MSTPRVERPITAAHRARLNRRAARLKNALRPDPMDRARDGKLAMFLTAVDPLEQLDVEERGVRAARLFRVWHADVGYEGSRKRRGLPHKTLVLADWLENVTKRSAPPASVGGADQEERDARTSPTPPRS